MISDCIRAQSNYVCQGNQPSYTDLFGVID